MKIIATIASTAILVVGAATVAYAYNDSRGGDIVDVQSAATHMNMSMPMTDADLPALQLARARLATAKYVNNLDLAKADGYKIITPHMPGMGWHFLNPSITGFDVRKPPILVYEKHGDNWQLGALEWVFPSTPTTPPLKGATYGSFPAACHYNDGTFVPAPAQSDCAATDSSGSPFFFWHPDLVTMHVWLWYPNPAGIYNSTNPLVDSFNSSN